MYAWVTSLIRLKKIRGVTNMVSSMILEKKILKSFLPEVVNWTLYVLNQSQTLAIKKTKLQNKLRVESNLQLSILEFLDVSLMFMCLTVEELSWMIRV